MYDIIIVGGGPAGLTAALYACRANKKVLVMEKAAFGGQITYSPKVENIPGFVSLTGNEFADKMVEQILEQGAEVEPCEVFEIKDGEIKTVVTDSGEFQAKAELLQPELSTAYRVLSVRANLLAMAFPSVLFVTVLFMRARRFVFLAGATLLFKRHFCYLTFVRRFILSKTLLI